MTGMEAFSLVTFAAISAVIACAINVYKHRSGIEGFLIGFFLNILGIVIVLGRPKLSAAPEMPPVWPAPLPPPGWYQDPADPRSAPRFWDGQQWSGPPPRPPAARHQVS